MVHNGIEYGLMAAYAEGLNILEHANAGATEREADAETTPLRDPDLYRYELDLPAIAELWRRGSVVPSWLLDLTAQALRESPDLTAYAGRCLGLGRRPLDRLAAIDASVPAPVLAAALSTASRRAAKATSPTRRSPPCVTASADTWRSRRVDGPRLRTRAEPSRGAPKGR